MAKTFKHPKCRHWPWITDDELILCIYVNRTQVFTTYIPYSDLCFDASDINCQGEEGETDRNLG